MQNIFRLMVEQASDCLMLHSEDGRILYASPGLKRTTGLTPEFIEREKYTIVVHPDDLEEAKKIRGNPKPGETWTATYRVKHGDGHWVWIEASTRLVFDELSGKYHEISVSRDVTERKMAELELLAARERAEAASRAKSLFLATMSHELRTPLNAIMGFSEVLKDGHLGPAGSAACRDYSAAIHSSGAHLLGLISDILDMAMLDSGQLELQRESVALNPIVEDCVRAVAPQAERAKVRVRCDLAAGDCTLDADPRRLRQMAMNLLSNAIKFSHPGGEVRVSTARDASGISICVADDGIGMESGVIPRVCEPFSQLDNSFSRKYEGAGIGLPLTKRFAELHGAQLLIDSVPGKGTVVRVVFSTARGYTGQSAA